MSEIVAVIKNNKSLIENITTSKVNVSDIIDNLITSATNKPLSAKQGVVLKGLIDVVTTNKLNASALEPAIAQVLLDAQAQVNAHNTSEDSHADLRLLISDYYAVVKSLLDSDDETLNQTSEIVAYIKSNKSLIDAITTSKVNVLDIVDNLTTNASNKPLSAKQGVALTGEVDQLSADKLSIAALSAAITQALTEAKTAGSLMEQTEKQPTNMHRMVDIQGQRMSLLKRLLHLSLLLKCMVLLVMVYMMIQQHLKMHLLKTAMYLYQMAATV
jgi:hypothetical protein